jgi:hypothetical protein
MRRTRAIPLCLLLSSCAPPETCAFPKTSPMLIAELFFGRANVTDPAWAAFTADTLTPNFPDGFTELAAAGQWREAPRQPIGREASQLVIIAAPDTPATRDHLLAVIATYRQKFDQKSVGLILESRCATF